MIPIQQIVYLLSRFVASRIPYQQFSRVWRWKWRHYRGIIKHLCRILWKRIISRILWKMLPTVALLFATLAQICLGESDSVFYWHWPLTEVIPFSDVFFISAQLTCDGTETFEKISGVNISSARLTPLYSEAGGPVTAQCNNR